MKQPKALNSIPSSTCLDVNYVLFSVLFWFYICGFLLCCVSSIFSVARQLLYFSPYLIDVHHGLIWMNISYSVSQKCRMLSSNGVLFFTIVPLGVIASFRKMKKLVQDHSTIEAALRTSSKLVIFCSFVLFAGTLEIIQMEIRAGYLICTCNCHLVLLGCEL